VEFALLVPFLAMLVFGTLDVGRVYRLQNRLKNAAREGAAYAQFRPREVVTGGSCTDSIQDRVAGEDPDLPSQAGYRVTVLQGSTALTGCNVAVVHPGDRVTVEVRADFSLLTPIVVALTGNPIVVTGRTTVEVQGQ
jgi:Flp pilus assembly protein TadG